MAPTSKPRIVMLGKPGAGKGTQGQFLARWLAIPHISTGDMLRTAMAAATPLGQKIQATMNRGGLVGDEEVEEVLVARLDHDDCRAGWILDGYPRRIRQAEKLDRIAPPTLAILLRIADQAANVRLATRGICPQGHIYNRLVYWPDDELCPKCYLPISGRSEDATPWKRQERLRAYRHETAVVSDYYQARGKLLTVDGEMPATAIQKFLLCQPIITQFLR